MGLAGALMDARASTPPSATVRRTNMHAQGTWTPVCLPLYSPDANVFAYICYLHKHGIPCLAHKRLDLRAQRGFVVRV